MIFLGDNNKPRKKLLIILLIVVAIATPFGAFQIYSNYSQLAKNEKEGIDYSVYTRTTDSDIAVIAIHGGGIEPGTSEIADQIADDKYNFYTHYGMKYKENFNMHITSTKFDDKRALDIVKNSSRTLSIHGCKGEDKITFIGGLDEELIEKVKKQLKKKGFEVEKAPQEIGAEDSNNICNLNKNKAGVQLELTSGLRNSFFRELSETGRQTKKKQFYKYVSALKEALKE